MNFEPQKFFIGVIDFFSILLPGAVLTYLLMVTHPGIFWARCPLGTEGWVVFWFSSYVLGHFLFLIGSCLDDYLYDPLRKMTKKEQITRLLHGRKLSPKLLRAIAWLCFKNDADAAIDRVVPIKESHLKRIEAPHSVNAFQWCKARLATEHPEALATVNRFEADSKFFRSFVPVILAVLGWALYCHQWWIAMGSIVAMGLAFLRYMEQRFKSTQQAYWYILTLEASTEASSTSIESSSLPSSEGTPDVPTHAGGVVFRKRGSRIKYLLLQAKTNPNDWVLPKGHIEPGEDPRRCAIREVKEETGVWARIKEELKISKYELSGKPVRVQFYLMEAVGYGKQENRLREHEWLPFDGAIDRTIHSGIKDLLTHAKKCAS